MISFKIYDFEKLSHLRLNSFLVTLFFLFSFIFCFSQPINLGFETGDLTGWTLQEGGNEDPLTGKIDGLQASTEYSVMLPSSTDPNSLPIMMISPFGGNSVRIGQTTKGWGGVAYKLSQTFTVDASSSVLVFGYSVVMENGQHACYEQNYHNFCVKDVNGNIIPANNSNLSILSSTACTTSNNPSYSTYSGFQYKNWDNVSYDLTTYIGAQVTVEFVVAGCSMSQGAHAGYAYFDASVCNNVTSPSNLLVNGDIYTLLQPNTNIALCGYDTTKIWAPVGATSFSWTGGSINGLTTQSVSITQPGVYKLQFNKPSACTNNASVTFTIGPRPTYTIQGISGPVCQGTQVDLSVGGAASYTWDPISAPATQTITYGPFNSFVAQSTSVYKLTIKGTNNCTTSTTCTVVVNPLPTLSVTGTASLCPGNSTTLTANSTADTYSWSTGATTNSIIVSPTVTANYSARASFAATGCAKTANFNVTVGTNVTVTLNKSKICIGDNVSAIGQGASSYTWSTGATTNSIIISPTVTTTYTLTGLAACGIIKQAVFTITVNPLPTFTINASPKFVCGTSPVLLSIPGASTYTWSAGVNSNNYTTPTVSTTYSVDAADANGCRGSSSILISVYPSPSITATSPTSICTSQSATLSVNGATSYTWNNGSNAQAIIVSPTVTTNYSVSSVDANGCGSIFNIPVTVVTGIPTFNFSSPSYTLCEGVAGRVVMQQTTYSYTCGQINTSITGNTLTINPVPSTPTIYTVTATNACGFVTHTVLVTPKPTPVISVNGPTLTCPGVAITYSASGATTYSWSGFASTASTLSVAPAINTIYAVTGITNGCNSTPQTMAVSVYSNNPVISTSSSFLCTGSSVTLTINGAITQTWTTGEVSSSIVVSPTSTTTYSASGTGTNNCIYTKTTSISVFGFPSISVSSGTICAGNNYTIVASGSGVSSYSYSSGSSVVSPTVSTNYTVTGISPVGCNTAVVSSVTVNQTPTITVNSGSICVGNIFNIMPSGAGTYWYSSNTPSVTPSVNTTYTVTGTYGPGCVGTGSAICSVTVNPPSTITVNSGTICAGQVFTMSPGGGITYVYSNGSKTVSPTSNSSYTVTGADANGCINTAVSSVVVDAGIPPVLTVNSGTICSGDSFTITPSGASTYSFSGGSSIVTPSVTTDYTITTNLACVGTYSVNSLVTVNPLPTVTVNSGTICSGDSFTIVPNGADTYTYSSGNTIVTPSGNTSYTITGADANGCVNTAVSSVVVDAGIPPVLTVNSGTICSGDSFTITPSGASTYSFSGGSSIVTPSVTTDYTITTNSGCAGTFSITSLVTVNPLPTVTVNSGTICSGSNFTITPSGADTYTYSSGGNIVAPSNNIDVVVTGTDINGCRDNFGAISSISVTTLPVVTVASSATTICENTSVSLYAGGADTYVWNTGASTQSLSIVPAVSTTYTVTGTDINNCSSTQTIGIVVDNTCQDVWPGDANSDGVADNLDVLELGLHYTQTGLPRASVSNNWQSYHADNWTGIITNGKNVNHSDCNGDGIINDDDTLAIFNNYGLVHAFKQNTQYTLVPELTIVPDQNAVVTGAWGSASVYLGDVTTPVNNVNGVAFTVTFDNTLIELDSMWIKYIPSFVNLSNQNLHFRKLDFINNNLYTATTHTINNNVSGNGLIGILHYKIKSGLTADAILNIGLTQGYKSENSGLITPLTVSSTTLMVVASTVGLLESPNGGYIFVIPNPTNGALTITSKTEIQKIEVVGITGQLLLSETPITTSHTLHLENLSNGIYFVNVYQNNRIVKREKIVLNK